MTRDEIWLEAVAKSKTETMPEHRAGYKAGYFDAALSRETEIASLRAKLEAVPVEPVPVESIKAALKALTFAWMPDNLKHADAIDRWLATVTK